MEDRETTGTHFPVRKDKLAEVNKPPPGEERDSPGLVAEGDDGASMLPRSAETVSEEEAAGDMEETDGSDGDGDTNKSCG